MKLLHQCGHCTTWNLNAFDEDDCGDGLIFSPVHQTRARLEAVAPAVRKASFFDPQYYLPNSQKSKLQSYDFFPEVIAAGFSTADFSLVAQKSARLCIEFQLKQEYDRVVIPARYFSQMDPDYTAKQDAYTVVPFLKEASRQRTKKPIFLTLPLTSHMIENASYRTTILDWVTSFPEIVGIYLIPDCSRPTKQILSETFLDEMLKLITEIREAGLKVTVGYLNTESLLYLLTGEIEITMGAYENTRMFSLDKFIESDEDRRGPKSRIYLTGLLNWIQFSEAKDLFNADSKLWAKAYRPTRFGDLALKRVIEPTFNQPVLYRHYFIAFAEQVAALKSLSRIDRYHVIRGWLKSAIALNEAIAGVPMDFERHGRGEHLQLWLDVINRYFARYLKP